MRDDDDLMRRIKDGSPLAYVRAKDVAAVSLTSERVIREHIRKGALPAERVGPTRRVRIRCSDARNYVYGRSVGDDS